MRALGVHIFAGGFSLGVERHFRLAGHLERSSYGVRVWRHNRPNVQAVVDKTARWRPEAHGEVDFVYGNPPCAPWSAASVGYVRLAASPYLEWAKDVLRVGREVGARVVAVESVRGAFLHGQQYYRQLRDDFKFGTLQWIFVNAVDHGLAQWRPRLFMVFSETAFVPRWKPRPLVSVLDAIAGAPDDEPIGPKSIYAVPGVPAVDMLKFIPAIKPGLRLRQTPDADLAAASSQAAVDGIRRAKFMGHELGRLHPDRPCPVVYGLARYVHPAEDRLLTLRELMRIQGYPDEFSFAPEGQATALRMLGKTVCPPVGEWLAREVAAHLRDERDVRYVSEETHECTLSMSPTWRKGGKAWFQAKSS